MSAPIAGKFQDHYATLGIDAKSDSDTIALAYTKASEMYHPNNPATGNREKFDAVTAAFEVLSDPLLRREFDKLKGASLEVGTPKFSGLAFFDALGRGTGLRLALLCVLYDRRRNRPFTPSLSMRHIENILESTEEELNFVLWYLKQRGLVNSDDKSSLQITVEGMDFVEQHRPAPEVVMPFVKATGLAARAGTKDVRSATAHSPVQPGAAAVPVATPVASSSRAANSNAEAPREHESLLSVMRRARAQR